MAKIQIEKRIIARPGDPPESVDIAPRDDGFVQVVIVKDGVRVTLVLAPDEAMHQFGVGLIHCGGEALRRAGLFADENKRVIEATRLPLQIVKS